jgi:hypothetical protein
MKIKLK